MRPMILAVAAAAALIGLSACDKSRQSADGTTQAGSAGTAAATPTGEIASTGSPEQGGANGTASATRPTINEIDRNTPDTQAVGKANSDAEARMTAVGGARH
jgi:hypothetical protein